MGADGVRVRARSGYTEPLMTLHLRRRTTALLAPAMAVAVTFPLATPAVAEPGLNGVDRDEWLPLTASPGDRLPRDRFLATDDCPFADELPPAFDADGMPRRGQDAPSPITVDLPGPGGEDLDTCGEVAADGMDVPDRLSLGSYVLFDIGSGDVLAAKDPYGLYRPASIIKALLLLTALDELDLDERIRVSDEAANIEGSRVGVGTEGRYTARQLLLGLVMRSGNDAAIALAEAMGGQDAVVRKMQDLADSLGTRATRVRTVHGLDNPGVQTTAYDMGLIYQAVFQDEEARKLLGTETMDFPGFGDEDGFQVSSDNGMLFNYPGTIGGKTGFTDNARHTFAVAAERGGRELGVVMLNSTIAAGRPWEQAIDLMDAGFDAPEGASAGGLVNASEGAGTAAGESSPPSAVAAAPPVDSDAGDSGDSSGAQGVDTRAIVGVGLAAMILVGLGLGAARLRRR